MNCKGRYIVTDCLALPRCPAEAIGYSKAIPAFLDPALKKADLRHGVSFASAASGYDDFTANLSVSSLELVLFYHLNAEELSPSYLPEFLQNRKLSKDSPATRVDRLAVVVTECAIGE